MHSFESKKQMLIRGFTADILIYTATIGKLPYSEFAWSVDCSLLLVAYGREPDFARKAKDQKPRRWHISRAS